MATLRNKRKLAAVTREIQEENPRNGQSRNTSNPRINEEFITQLSEEIEGRVSKKLSQEFSRTESRILGALSNIDEFLLNQQIRTHSETVPGTFRNTNVGNQGTNEDDSQSEPHPEAGIFRGQTTQNSGPKDCRATRKKLGDSKISMKTISTKLILWTHKIQFWKAYRTLSLKHPRMFRQKTKDLSLKRRNNTKVFSLKEDVLDQNDQLDT